MSSSSDDAPCGSCQQLVCRGQKGLDCDLYANHGIISSVQLSLPPATMPLGRARASCGSVLRCATRRGSRSSPGC